jgi:hypothetical protein
MDAQDIRNLQEAYMGLYQELDEDGYKSPYQAPPAGGRTLQGNPAKGETLGNPARLSPAMKAMQRSDQLQRTEPGSRRQVDQTRRSNQLNRTFASARRSGGSGGSSTRGLTSGASPSGLTGRFQVGTGTMLANSYEPDLYDTILSHLLDEGYANTQESALVIMSNMSEEWMQSIVEGMGLSVGSAKMIGKLTSNPRTPEAQATKAAQKNITDPIGFAVKGATKAVLGVGDEKNKQMMQKRFPN